MNRFYITSFILIVNLSIYAQKMDFRCNNKLFSVRYETWIDPIQSCDDRRYDFYSDAVNINDIPQHDLEVINETSQSIIEEGGEEFYDKLILKQVIISERPNKCNGKKYSLRYFFPLDSTFYYRFSLTYDENGNLLSEYPFPDFSKNKNILNIIDKCEAISIALNDPVFKKAYDNSEQTISRKIEGTDKWEKLGSISNMKLIFDSSKNIWIWKLFSDTNFDGEVENKSCISGVWLGKVIVINAHNANIISVEDYKEYKSILSFRTSTKKNK